LPLYAYRCTKCGHKFEKIQNFSAEPEKECPKCGGVLERPLTAPALNFKGAGWYVNDYASKSSVSAESASEAVSDSAKPSTPTESKASSTSSESAPSAPAATPAPTTPSSTT